MEHTVDSAAPAMGRMENRTLRERVYEVLRDDILSGHLAPGAELSEVALADRLGVSRGPIREALGLLWAQGLVLQRGIAEKFGHQRFGRGGIGVEAGCKRLRGD